MMQVIQRLHRPRQKVLDIVTEPIDWDSIPPVIKQDKTLSCSSCTNTNAQWYIMAVKQKGGLTNGVLPGLKCNACKEMFLRQYLQPTWKLNKSEPWQAYGLILLKSHDTLSSVVHSDDP
jgi:hypothetical protein